jgi:integrase
VATNGFQGAAKKWSRHHRAVHLRRDALKVNGYTRTCAARVAAHEAPQRETHWAVRHLRAGVPVAVVQAQLGHSTPVLTLKVYGAFVPSGEARAKWEALVRADTDKRRETR